MTDLLIVGGGIMGLWAGVMAERAGLKTLLVERERLGSGASGGVLGALMPYMPDKWDLKKQLQFEALTSLQTDIAFLESETGLSAGYRRSGRIIPLPKPHLRKIALRHEQDALVNWTTPDRRYLWQVKDGTEMTDWPEASFTQSGIILDTLAARVDPRALIAVLGAYLRGSRHVRVEEGQTVAHLDPASGLAVFSDGTRQSFGACILSAGVQSFPLLDALHPASTLQSGMAVKGQAALLRASVDPAMPVIFLDGIYIVPHDNGLVAIGSTSEDAFEAPFTTDEKLDRLIERACAVAPALDGAPIVERWAGLRPKATGRDPMVGRHPDQDRLHVLTGGFKISFGIANRLARSVVGGVLGTMDDGLPMSFRCATHIDTLRQRVSG